MLFSVREEISFREKIIKRKEPQLHTAPQVTLKAPCRVKEVRSKRLLAV